MNETNSRRSFLQRSALGVAGLSVANLALVEDAVGSGIPAVPAVAPYAAKPLKPSTLSMNGISRRTMEEHYKLYVGYVNKANEILEALKTVDHSKANQTFSQLRALKVELSFAVGGIKNHEIYFDHLGGSGGVPTGPLLEQINRDFGSYEAWERDFRATGLAARGWVWLAFDLDRSTLFNYLGDAQNTFPIWNAVPVAALDTYEHAYFIDFATDRKTYIDAFMKNLDWNAVEARFAAVPRKP